jgi:exosome complex RNA-binding protein Rrp4
MGHRASNIVTPEEIIETEHYYPKPRGIYWEELDEEKIRAIPLLRRLKKQI